MLLAELEIYHTRPAVPTRRVSLGNLILPTDPAPGFGGLLIGAVVARHIGGVDADVHADIKRLILEVERGQRVVQPRLRHRFQVDRHGLARSLHQMHGEGDDIEFEFGTHGSDLAMVLGAVYAAERLDGSHRRLITPVLTKALTWRGPIGPALIAYLAGSTSAALTALADPRGWAMEVLGFDVEGPSPSKRDVTKRYRRRMRDVHPDHGGAAVDASKAILDLNEARRILSAEAS
ncbi:MAG: hypothetical protein CL424_08435 [Acidimicrobiaceae bacterium]|nr:hypothetical protein [Acidimicrobiaceae bacterium]